MALSESPCFPDVLLLCVLMPEEGTIFMDISQKAVAMWWLCQSLTCELQLAITSTNNNQKMHKVVSCTAISDESSD